MKMINNKKEGYRCKRFQSPMQKNQWKFYAREAKDMGSITCFFRLLRYN